MLLDFLFNKKKKYCPKCNAINNAKSNYCINCNSSLPETVSNGKCKFCNKILDNNNPYYCSDDCRIKYSEKFEIYSILNGAKEKEYYDNLKKLFCQQCLDSINLEIPFEGSYSINFMGTTIIGKRKLCKNCNSYITTKWMIFFIPILPIAHYRVKEINPDKSILSTTKYIGFLSKETIKL